MIEWNSIVIYSYSMISLPEKIPARIITDYLDCKRRGFYQALLSPADFNQRPLPTGGAALPPSYSESGNLQGKTNSTRMNSRFHFHSVHRMAFLLTGEPTVYSDTSERLYDRYTPTEELFLSSLNIWERKIKDILDELDIPMNDPNWETRPRLDYDTGRGFMVTTSIDFWHPEELIGLFVVMSGRKPIWPVRSLRAMYFLEAKNQEAYVAEEEDEQDFANSVFYEIHTARTGRNNQSSNNLQPGVSVADVEIDYQNLRQNNTSDPEKELLASFEDYNKSKDIRDIPINPSSRMCTNCPVRAQGMCMERIPPNTEQ